MFTLLGLQHSGVGHVYGLYIYNGFAICNVPRCTRSTSICSGEHRGPLLLRLFMCLSASSAWWLACVLGPKVGQVFTAVSSSGAGQSTWALPPVCTEVGDSMSAVRSQRVGGFFLRDHLEFPGCLTQELLWGQQDFAFSFLPTCVPFHMPSSQIGCASTTRLSSL